MRTVFYVVLIAMLVLPFTALAQDDGWVDIVGDYTFEGAFADDSESYSGDMTIEGDGSVYWTTFTSGDDTQTAPALRLGNVVVQGYRNEECSPTVYTRLDDGRLLGMWVDRFFYDTLGVEVLTPLNVTEGFAGGYMMEGIFGDAATYSQTVRISVDVDGVYELMVSNDDGDTVVGRGFAVGNILGIVQTLSYEDVSIDDCGVWVAEFYNNGTYSGKFYENGIGYENGSRID